MAQDKTDAAIENLTNRVEKLETLVRRLRFGVQSTPEAIEKSEKGICVYCDQPIELGKKVIRGCHERCYRSIVRRLELEDDFDLDDVIESGHCLAMSPPGRKRKPGKIDDLIALKQKTPPVFDDSSALEIVENARRKKKKPE
jgi:hypothetical protein